MTITTTGSGVRWAVRATLLLGVAASVTANVLHARDNPISQAIAAWPPLALLITVELLSRIPITRPLVAGVRIGATAVIAGIAAWVSYWHMAGVAARYGEREDAAHLLPLSVDGLIIVASICLVELGRTAKQPERAPAPAEPAAVSAPAAPAGDSEPTFTEADLDAGDADDAAVQPLRQDLRTKQEIESAVRAIKAAQPDLSQRKIAAAVLVSPSTVGRILGAQKINGHASNLVHTPEEN